MRGGHWSDRPRPTKAQRDGRAAAVAMLYAALEGLSPEKAVNALSAALRDDKRFTSAQLEELGNSLGREAHSRARLEDEL